MALQVWLPLNGNTNNQGVMDMTMTGTPASWSSGKLGKCGTFYNSLMYGPNDSKLHYLDNFSWCCWINPHYQSDWGAQYVFTVGRADSDSFGYGLRIIDAATLGIWFGNKQYTCAASSGAWIHLAFVKEGTTLRTYINGQQAGVVTFDGTLPTYKASLGLGLGAFYYTGGTLYNSNFDMNDFRIYDNALSIKEIKEISKGLVIHYPLNDVVNTVSVNKYSGDNAEGKTSDMNKAICTKLENERGYNYKMSYTGNGSNVWAYIHYPSVSFEVGKTYDYSCKIRVHSTSNTAINIRAARCHNDWTTNTRNLTYTDGEWHEYHLQQTITGTTFERSSSSDVVTTSPKFEIYTSANMAESGTVFSYDFDIKDVQISEFYNKSEVQFNDGQYADNTIYDTSGFGNHAHYTAPNLCQLELNSPRNLYSYKFSATSIIEAVIDTEGFANTFTFAYWAKKDQINSCMAFCCGTRLNLYPNNNGFYWNRGDGLQNPFCKSPGLFAKYNGDWHHYAITGDGTSAKLYIDAKYMGTATTFRGLTGDMGGEIRLNGWPIDPLYQWDGGSISDFRLYSTPLSEDDIKELYQAPMAVSSNGTFFVYGEFIEKWGELL